MREMIAIPIFDDDLTTMKAMISDVANDPEHKDRVFMEVEFLNDLYMNIEAVWEPLCCNAVMAVTNQSDVTDSYWFDPDDLTKERYIDVGGDQVVRLCKCM